MQGSWGRCRDFRLQLGAALLRMVTVRRSDPEILGRGLMTLPCAVVQDVRADPTLPRTRDVRCPECSHNEAVFFSASTEEVHDLLAVLPLRAVLPRHSMATRSTDVEYYRCS